MKSYKELEHLSFCAMVSRRITETTPENSEIILNAIQWAKGRTFSIPD
jgi:hypothetical protein